MALPPQWPCRYSQVAERGRSDLVSVSLGSDVPLYHQYIWGCLGDGESSVAGEPTVLVGSNERYRPAGHTAHQIVATSASEWDEKWNTNTVTACPSACSSMNQLTTDDLTITHTELDQYDHLPCSYRYTHPTESSCPDSSSSPISTGSSLVCCCPMAHNASSSCLRPSLHPTTGCS